MPAAAAAAAALTPCAALGIVRPFLYLSAGRSAAAVWLCFAFFGGIVTGRRGPDRRDEARAISRFTPRVHLFC